MSSEKPKICKCPFCEKDINIKVWLENHGTGNMYFVRCGNCGAQGPVEDDVYVSIFDWNHVHKATP